MTIKTYDVPRKQLISLQPKLQIADLTRSITVNQQINSQQIIKAGRLLRRQIINRKHRRYVPFYYNAVFKVDDSFCSSAKFKSLASSDLKIQHSIQEDPIIDIYIPEWEENCINESIIFRFIIEYQSATEVQSTKRTLSEFIFLFNMLKEQIKNVNFTKYTVQLERKSWSIDMLNEAKLQLSTLLQAIIEQKIQNCYLTSFLGKHDEKEFRTQKMYSFQQKFDSSHQQSEVLSQRKKSYKTSLDFKDSQFRNSYEEIGFNQSLLSDDQNIISFNNSIVFTERQISGYQLSLKPKPQRKYHFIKIETYEKIEFNNVLEIVYSISFCKLREKQVYINQRSYNDFRRLYEYITEVFTSRNFPYIDYCIDIEQQIESEEKAYIIIENINSIFEYFTKTGFFSLNLQKFLEDNKDSLMTLTDYYK